MKQPRKRCSRCRKPQDHRQFNKNIARGNRRAQCRRCDRDIKLRKKYGITLHQYETLYKKQKGRCAICSKPRRKLAVDHHHGTGRVRGLLCLNTCNPALGSLADDPRLMVRAAAYVLDHMEFP